MKRFGLALPLALLILAGCDALTAHSSVAARAGSQELPTERLAKLIGNSTVPLAPVLADNQQLARAVVDVWVNYHLLGQAAALRDSLKNVSKMDPALWQQFNQAKNSKFRTELVKLWQPSDTVATEAEYNQGTLLSAAHILLMFPPGASPPQVDSVRKAADRLRKEVTTTNFPQMVKTHSKDNGSLANNGLYAAFPRGMMAREFEEGVLALKPGEISAPIQTVYGFHIIRRPMFEEVKAEHSRAKVNMGMHIAESTFVTRAQNDNKIEVRSNAPKLLRDIVQNLEKYRNDKSVIATFRGGRYTAADFARLIRSVPQRQQVMQNVMQMPDSIVPRVLAEVVYNDFILPRMADSAKVGLDSTEIAGIRLGITNLVVDSWNQLGIEPSSLGDSAGTAERQRKAAAQVELYIDGMMASTRPYVPVPDPLEMLLRSTYDMNVSQSGIMRALEQAVAIRAEADSARARQQRDAPPSLVPMPGDSGKAAGGAPPPSGRGG
jgi:peptidyl-prolyl cis-trans isomerase D